MKITDPLTGKSIDWISPPEAPMYTIPIAACTDDRQACRWMMLQECPDLTATLSGNLYVAGKTWQVGSFGLWQFAADLSFTKLIRKYEQFVAYGDILFGAGHLGTALHAGPTVLEFTTTVEPQGAGALHLMTCDGTAITDLGAIDYEGGKVPATTGSLYSIAYMPKSCITADNKRVLGAAWKTADGNLHASVFTNTSYATTGWVKQCLIQGGSYRVHALATSGSGASTIIVAAFGSLYGGTNIGLAFTLDNGTTWYYLTPGGAVAIADANGLTAAAYTAAGYWLTNAGADAVVPARILLSGTNAYLSAIHFTPSVGDLLPSGNSRHYFYHFNLSTGAYDRHGPFLPGIFGSWAGLDCEWSGSLIRCAKPIAVPNVNTDPGYTDYPQGGPTIGIYSYDPALLDTAPTLTKTIALDGLGSSLPYVDRIPTDYPWAHLCYGDGQVFLGCRWVKGSTGKLAVNVSDQRPQDVEQNFHMSRVKIIDVTV
jgi:hypothetical protein